MPIGHRVKAARTNRYPHACRSLPWFAAVRPRPSGRSGYAPAHTGRCGKGQGFPPGGKGLSRAALADNDAAGGGAAPRESQRRLQQARRIGRIEENQIKDVLGVCEIGRRLQRKHLRPGGKARGFQVPADDQRRLRVFIHKDAARRAAAERLDAELAGSGKQIENPPPLNVKLYGAEQRLLDPLGSGAGVLPGEGLERRPRAVPVITRILRPPPVQQFRLKS